MLKDNLNKLISNSGFSIRKIAELADLPYSTLYEINSGLQTNPTITTLIKLSFCFNLTIEDLVYNEITTLNLKIDKKIPKIQIHDYMMVFNRKLITLCNDAGLNLAKLTRLSGLPRSTLEGILKRKHLKSIKLLRSTRLSTIAPLAKAFNISLDELIGLSHLHKKKTKAQ